MKPRKFLFLISTFLFILIISACNQKDNEMTSNPPPSNIQEEPEGKKITIGAMKGPTGMGLALLLGEDNKAQQVDIYGSADELLPKIIQKEVDIAMVPANVAALLFNKTKGAVKVFGINTWGALYILSTQEDIHSIEDLDGKTIYTVGQGSTPEFALKYILSHYDIQVDIEYRAEATELAALLQQGEIELALLPEPFASVVLSQNDQLTSSLNLTDEWNKVSDFSMVTGVCIAQKDFLDDPANTDGFQAFLADYESSIQSVIRLDELAMNQIVAAGMVPKAAMAQLAIPRIGITYTVGEKVRDNLEPYLQTLFEADPASIGGALPTDDFYFHD